MIFHVAKNRQAAKWAAVNLTFSEFVKRFKNPVRSPETFEEFCNYPKNKQDALKDVGGYVGGELKDGARRKDSVINRTLVTLDADSIEGLESLTEILRRLRELNVSYVAHPTRKSTPLKPRYRIIIPLKEPLLPVDYEPVVRGLCEILGMEHFDRTTVDINRLMYWPSVSVDQEYRVESNVVAPPLDGVEFLKGYYGESWEVGAWPMFPEERRVVEKLGKKAEDPLTKENYVGTFCRAYSIHEAIETFLSDVYRREAQDRYTYIPGSTAGGAIVFDDKWLYSYHSTDPACEMELNSFDLVRVHLFGTTKKSESKMLEFIEKDERYQAELLKERMEDFKDLDPDDEGRIKELFEKLKTDKKTGAVLPTIENFTLILTEDPAICGKYHHDIFADRRIVTGKLPWHKDTYNLPRSWSDDDEAGLRTYLERKYKLDKGQTKLDDAITNAFRENRIHPVRNYLNGLPAWDKVPRVDTLLIDYFDAVDNVYTREVIKKTLLAAVTRVYEPGAKFDNIPVLIGKQGIGKSTFIYNLSPKPDWYVDTDPRFNGRESYESIQNKWLVEMGELKSLNRKEAEQTKQFISRQSDYYRLPYAKNPEEHPRQCVFVATTNNKTFLTDNTGNRRFWPIELETREPKKSVWEDLPEEREQIWAEVLELYRNGETLLLSRDASVYAELEQNSRMEDDPRRGEIVEFIKHEIPVDWESESLKKRMVYWDSADNCDDPLKRRDKICAREIMTERYNVLDNYTQRMAKEINAILDTIPGLVKQKAPMRFGKPYGLQRGYQVTTEFFELNT